MISLPALVEEKAAFYRTTFLSWTHDFPKRPLMGPVIRLLKAGRSISFWWTTSLGQRFISTHLLRLMM